MAKTNKKIAKKSTRNGSKKDRHLTPVIVTASGTVIAGKRRIDAFLKESSAKVIISETHHYAMLPFLRVAKDDDGHMHLCTITVADENAWHVIA